MTAQASIWLTTYDVACPYCGAGPSKQCRNMRSPERDTTIHPHPERTKAQELIMGLIQGKVDARFVTWD